MTLMSTYSARKTESMSGSNRRCRFDNGLTPFDKQYKTPDDFSERLARNQQLLLKEGKPPRPHRRSCRRLLLGGNTHCLHCQRGMENSSSKLKTNGGFYDQLKAGTVQKAINETCDKRHADVARRKESLLGTNQFPNFNEMAADKIETEGCCGKSCGCSHDENGTAVEALRGTRAASDFEALRLETERSGKRPKCSCSPSATLQCA